MAHHSLVFHEGLPFSIPQVLLGSVLVSPNYVETLKNAEHFMAFKEYHTAATLFTVVLHQLRACPQLVHVASILCKRAECLLYMNYVQHVLRDCEVAVRMIGGADEHVAFLLLRALELQGEVLKAYLHAVMYKTLDPEMKRDKGAVSRLRSKVEFLCGQGDYQVYRTINDLMTTGKIFFHEDQTKVALKFFTEVLSFSPEVLEAHEYRAQCLFNLGDLLQAQNVCVRVLNLSQRTSTAAFDTLIKIKIQWEQIKEALELVKEWRMIDPLNKALDRIEMSINERMRELPSRTETSQSQSMFALSVGNKSGGPDETTTTTMPRGRRSPKHAKMGISGAEVFLPAFGGRKASPFTAMRRSALSSDTSLLERCMTVSRYLRSVDIALE